MFKKVLLVLLALPLLAVKSGAEDSTMTEKRSWPPKNGIWALQINVINLDQAIGFYTGLLEFDILSRDGYPRVVPLVNKDGAHIFLFQCLEETIWMYDTDAKINLNLYVQDLDNFAEKADAAGVRFVEREIKKAQVGNYVRILDPSGNELHVMQLSYEHEPVHNPTVYNCGIQVSNMQASRRFYTEGLGFEVLTEKYYPPVVPYKSQGIEFILHEGATTKRNPAYTEGTQMLLVTLTPNLDTAMARMNAMGYTPLKERPSRAPVGRYMAYRDPDGNVVELLEWQDNSFDRLKRGE